MSAAPEGLLQRLKARGKALLRARGKHLLWVPPGSPTGFDFIEDLRLLVATPRPLCLDIGANAGQTIDWLQAVFESPVIHAFEPAAEVFDTLRAKAVPGRVHTYRQALGRRREQREFIHYGASVLSSFLPLDRRPDNRFRNVAERGRETLEVDTVDDFLQVQGIDVVDLLKIDTQGFDLDVLAGADAALADGRVRVVMVELNFAPIYEGQASASAIVDQLAAHGYALVDCYDKVRQNHTIAYCNGLFARRGNEVAAL